MIRGVAGFVIAATLVGATNASADNDAINLGDLAAYRAALTARPKGESPPVTVTFRELWEHPKAFEGRRVRVEGRVVRRFHQPAFGTFPPLVEAWSASASGDAFCLVYPDPKDPRDQALAAIRFDGTFLRLVRYQAEDTARLAPLIVGDRAPLPLKKSTRMPGVLAPRIPWLDWVVGLLIAGLVAVILARQHLSRPAPRVRERADRELPSDFFLEAQDGQAAQNVGEDPASATTPANDARGESLGQATDEASPRNPTGSPSAGT